MTPPTPSEPRPTRCPSPACRQAFTVAAAPGEPACCPVCGQPLTVKPATVWRVLEQREAAQAASDDDALARLDAPLGRGAGSPLLRERLFHRSDDPRWALARHDVCYEASRDREAPAAAPAPGLIAVLDDLRSQWNVGAIFRTAEGLGWGGLRLCGTTPLPTTARVTRVSLGAEQHLSWTYQAEVLAALGQLAAEGYLLVALEQTDDALSLGHLDPPERLALVVGNEVGGISREALGACQQRVLIPMAGHKSSLNVAVAFGIAAATLRRRWIERHQRPALPMLPE